ncbi:MAG: hypothetical protein K2X38_22760 [Gemmataceae bacterium]|nr:hypothetical protein [Gemmataceae bacterium]
MNPTTTSASAPAAEIPLTRAAKEKLLLQMYSRKHWIELIRLFRYQTLPMEQARKEIEPLAKEFGKESMAAACEALIEIATPGKETVARLKPHVRRMAYQMLGPEPAADTVPAMVVPSPPADPQPVATTPQPRESKKARRRSTPKSASPAAASPARASKDGHCTIMEQYRAAKEKHPAMLLLFRMGDFYELFGEDAETAHKLLGLTLTTRDRTITMAGFPHHQLEVYLRKLLHEGQRVAICEPVEESLTRGPIRREVTRVVTPGTMTDDEGVQSAGTSDPRGAARVAEGQPVRQPRHFVLKRCEAWFKEAGLAFVAIDDVRRTTPAVVPYVGVLDFIVLRGEEKLLVTVRPYLQAKHLAAISELQNLYGPAYKPVRLWPSDGPDGWEWRDYPIAASTSEPTIGTERKSRSKRPRPSISQ